MSLFNSDGIIVDSLTSPCDICSQPARDFYLPNSKPPKRCVRCLVEELSQWKKAVGLRCVREGDEEPVEVTPQHVKEYYDKLVEDFRKARERVDWLTDEVYHLRQCLEINSP